MRSPSVYLRYKAELYKKDIYSKYKYDLPILSQYIIFLTRNKFIDSDYQQKIDNMTKNIKNLKIELYQTGFKVELEKRVRKTLKFTKDSLEKYYSSIEFFKTPTLEYFAESLKNKYLLIYTVYKNNRRVFDIQHLDVHLFNKIIAALNTNDISTEKFREIARSNIWRNYWLGNKNNLFGISAKEYSEEQKFLCMFSRMYDNAYEHPECPDESIINDDDKFDGWLLLQQDKNKDEKKKNKYSHIDPKYSEVFVFASSQDEANKIYDDNTLDAKRILKERAQLLKQKGTVRDIEFRDTKLDILEKSSKAAMQNIRK